MLSQTAFTINIWIVSIWLVAGAAYSIYAIWQDICDARKKNEK